MSDFGGKKCTKFDLGWGSAPDPIWGAYMQRFFAGGAHSAPPDSMAAFKGLYF